MANITFIKLISPRIQWITTFGAFLLMMQFGIQMGWTSPNLARFMRENSTIQLSPSEASWVVSSGTLGGMAGSILGSIFIVFFGSRMTILLAFVFNSCSWTSLLFADSLKWLLVSRFFCGFAMIISLSCYSLYLGEVSKPSIRGTSISIAAAGNSVGIVIGTAAETYLPMKITSSIYLAQCLIGITLFFFLLDSPYHLVKKNNPEEARKSIALYNNGNEIEKELYAITEFVSASNCQTTWDKLRQLRQPVIRKSLFLIITIFALSRLSGVMVLISYTEIILTRGKASLIKEEQFVIYANILGTIVTLSTAKLIDKVGRRHLLIFSSLGATLGMVGLGAHFYLLNSNFDVQNLSWLANGSILLYIIMFFAGLMSVPSTVLSEIFPQDIKNVAVCLTSLAVSFFAFLSLKTYEPLLQAMDDCYVYWIYAGFTALLIPCVLFLMPETKGKTFQEIQDDLMKK